MAIATRALILLALLVAAANAENFTWLGLTPDTTASSEPPARHSAAMGAWDGVYYVFGGIGNLHNGSRMFGLGMLQQTTEGLAIWETLSVSGGPSPRYGMIYGVYEHYLLLSHGRNESGDLFSDTWAFDMQARKWMIVNTSWSLPEAEGNETEHEAPEGRLDPTGGVWGNSLWLSMGRNKAGRTLSDLWVLEFEVVRYNGTDIFVGEWEMLDEGVGYNQYHLFLPHARFKHSGAPLGNNSFVFFGGCASGGYVGGPCPLGDSWMYEAENGTWTRLDDCSSPVNEGVMIPLSENRGLLLFGDEQDGLGAYPQLLSSRSFNSSDMSIVDVENQTWIITRGMGGAFPAKRTNPAIARDFSSNTIFIYGGRNVDDPEKVYGDLWVLTWTREDGDPRSCPNDYFSFVHLHGVLMYVAWGLLLPLGVLIGRYYRHYWPFWFIIHIIVHSLGVLLTVAGFVLIFLVGSYSEPNFAHAIVGIVLTGMLIHQFLNGIFHPCVDRENGQTPTEEKSAYRRCWEIYHALSGFLSITLGLGQVTLGVFLVVAPFEVWVTWCALGLAWILVFFLHEVVFLAYKIYTRVKKQD